MIVLTPQHQLFVWVDAIDFRKGVDALIGHCRLKLNQNPFSGAIFAFRNKKGNAVKLLTFDGTGFWLMYKRFSQGVLQFWPKNQETKLCATTMMVILNQGQPGSMKPAWRELPSSSCAKVSL
jgi:transposase